MMLRDETQAALNDLIRQCGDARERYEAAAAETQNTDLHELFDELAAQRQQMGAELQSLDRSLGDIPHARDPDLKAARDLLARLRTALSADEDMTLLAECEEVDSALANRMTEALNHGLPDRVRDVVLRQQCEVTASIGRLAAERARL